MKCKLENNKHNGDITVNKSDSKANTLFLPRDANFDFLNDLQTANRLALFLIKEPIIVYTTLYVFQAASRAEVHDKRARLRDFKNSRFSIFLETFIKF